MCHKIRCDGESWKLFGFQGEVKQGPQNFSQIHSATRNEPERDTC